MEKLSELTISDVKEFTEGKIATISSMDDTAMSIHMKDAVVIADPETGADGKIAFFEPKSGYKVELDSDKAIESIFGNENTIKIVFVNDMGVLDISITGEKVSLIHPIQKKYG